MIYDFLIAPGVMFLWGFAMMPLAILLAGRYGLIDLPGKRKIHTTPIPRGGGIALWSGMMTWAMFFASDRYPLVPVAMSGATIVFFAGYLDDMLALSPFPRLIAQFTAATLGLWAVQSYGAMITPLGCFVGILWIAGSVNAYNFIDGMNGLSLAMAATSSALMAFLGFGFWSGSMAALCAGAFLWNFPRARSFMGDGGVYLLGYLIGLLQVAGTLNWIRTLWAIPLLLLLGGVPTADTILSVFRRLLKGKSPFYPDRGHLHHKLLDKGYSQGSTLLVITFLHAVSLSCAALIFIAIKKDLL